MLAFVRLNRDFFWSPRMSSHSTHASNSSQEYLNFSSLLHQSSWELKQQFRFFFLWCKNTLCSCTQVPNSAVSIRTTGNFISNCVTSTFSTSLLLIPKVALRSAWLFHSSNLWTMSVRYYENRIFILISSLQLKGCNLFQAQAL